MEKIRSLFISDVHLGSSKSLAEDCIEMLKQYDFEYLYIVGDFIDIWQIKRKKYWPQSHTNLVRKVLKKSKNSKVIYILGNHDEFLSHFISDMTGEWGNITICEKYYHTGKNNKKYLVIHGHQLDYVSRYSKWLEYFGDIGYEFLLKFNKHFNRIRKTMGLGYWSISSYIKNKCKQAINYVSKFEETIAHLAEIEKVDGIITGHLHYPNIRKIHNVDYLNDGDWVEHKTVIIEDLDGNFFIKKH